MVFEEFVTSTSQMTACLCTFLFYIQAQRYFTVVGQLKKWVTGNYSRNKLYYHRTLKNYSQNFIRVKLKIN